MRLKIFFLLCSISFYSVLSQNNSTKKYWVFFKDKGPGINEHISFAKSSHLQSIAKSGLSERALLRRAKILPSEKIVDYDDIPVYSTYLNSIEQMGFKSVNILKWFNAVTLYSDDEGILKIKNLNFVKEIKPVTEYKFKNKEDVNGVNQEIFPVIKKSSTSVNHKFKYGLSSVQNEIINVPLVHDMNISGKGVIVGMLDTGFRWRLHNSLKTRNVLKEYDFVFKDSVTANQNNDQSNQDSHGTLTFSTLGGFMNDTLIGPGYNADFLLAKTEDVRSETKVEEDNWASAIEWMEGLGVDITSTSLGYSDFDNVADNYTYSQMNGSTAIITIAAEKAIAKGVVCVVSAGNEGNSVWRYITAPADGKNVITVGAANADGSKAGFSSFGPTSDGRIKPDISALGVSVWGAVAGTVSSYNPASGTSLSCPLVGGVAALILSTRPELTPSQVRDALRNTASSVGAPDNLTGWGIIDAYKAITYHGLVYSNEPEISISNGKILISTYLASRFVINKQSVKINYSINDLESLVSLNMTLDSIIDNTNSGKYSIAFPVSGILKIKFYFTGSDANGERRQPYTATSFYAYKPTQTDVIDRDKPINFILHQNYPNPFNPLTNIGIALKENLSFKIIVYNYLGQKVKEIFDGKREAGEYFFQWDGTHGNGKPAPTGLYYYKLISDKFNQTKSMLLIR